MKSILGLVLLSAAVSLVGAGTALALYAAFGKEAAPPAPAAAGRAAPDLSRRVESLEARVEELSAALARTREEAASSREQAAKETEAIRAVAAKERERADAAEALVSGYTLEPRPGAAERKPEDMDAFAKEVSRSMRQGIRQEFRRISDLITSPTPEALEQRRRQLRMFAAAFGNNAGLDQAQIATLERILNETDEKARDDLRPLLQGVEDYRALDYRKIRRITDDSFAVQNEQFDREYPKEKSERLKQQLEPVRNLFGAMLDELQKESAAPRGE